MRLRVEQQRLCCSSGQRHSRIKIVLKMSPTWWNKAQVLCQGSRGQSSCMCDSCPRPFSLVALGAACKWYFPQSGGPKFKNVPAAPRVSSGGSEKPASEWFVILVRVPICPLSYLPKRKKNRHTRSKLVNARATPAVLVCVPLSRSSELNF